MTRNLLVFCSLLLLAASCNATSSTTLSSLQPPKLTVNLSYNIGGQMMSLSTPCTQQAPGAECLPKPHARRDSVMINYAVMANATANTSDTVLLKACYSPFSRVNRPWRALNDIIAKSKACPFQIAKGLNPSAGNTTWKIPANVPIGTYFIRSLVYSKNATDSSGLSDIPVAIGDSKGFFEVIPISHREHGLVIAAGLCICAGPVLFTGLMLWEFKFKAPKKIA